MKESQVLRRGRMPGVRRWITAAVFLLVFAPGITWSVGQGGKSTVILVSIDGFRPDYLDHTSCPNLRELAVSGTRAEWLIPIFPTKTFPNHYAIATGLYAENNGVVANTMYDPGFDAMFTMRMRNEVTNARWWGGEPIWVTAEKQGVISAPFFWPGSEAPIGGLRPSYYRTFDQSMSEELRVAQVLQWLDLPEKQRPRFVTLYFDRLDTFGHEYGPDYASVDTAVRVIDEAIGKLIEGLKARKLFEAVTLIVVSDHGMAAVAKERTVYLDDYLAESDSVRIVDWGIVVSLWPRPGTEDRVFRAVKGAHPRMSAFLKDSIPSRWHYRSNRRVAPVVLVADEGWTISSRKDQRTWGRRSTGGNHGYDNQSSSMRAIFIAHGPQFKAGKVVGPFENIQIYNLLCSLLQIVPAPNDGDMKVAKSIMK